MYSPIKTYDAREVYGTNLTVGFAYKFGRAYGMFLDTLPNTDKTISRKDIVVGRDARWHSEPLFAALVNGIRDQGYNVIDIGHVSTCMTYYANGAWKLGGSVMITASHNTAEWNGFKPCREDAIPLTRNTNREKKAVPGEKFGLDEIEKFINDPSNDFSKPAPVPRGTLTAREVIPGYVAYIQSKANLPAKKQKLRVAIDYGNGMGVVEAKAFSDFFDITPLYDIIDGRFPNHEANPLHHETLRNLQLKMLGGNYDFGIAFDGDGDRVGFLDETGQIIPLDLITALIAKDILSRKENKGATILHDLRSSWVVAETIKKCGGKASKCPVGHSLIKNQMRRENAPFAGELSGHYYFADNFTAESSALAVFAIASIVEKSSAPLSKLVEPLRAAYHKTPELNHRVKDTGAVLKKIEKAYEKMPGAKRGALDGLTFEFGDWWFNIRCSNTEPLIRLNLEAKTRARMEAERDELLKLIK